MPALLRTRKASTYARYKRALAAESYDSSSSSTIDTCCTSPNVVVDSTNGIGRPDASTDSKETLFLKDEQTTATATATATARATKTSTSGEAVRNIDPRHPVYLGEWERSIPHVHTDLAQDDIDEPHFKRKVAILRAHPEVRKLYGPEWTTKWILFGAVALQLAGAYTVGQHTDGILVLLLASYFLGGTLTGFFGVLVHECAHNLLSASRFANRLYALVANLGIPFPIAASFRRYHLEHHVYQGVNGKDPDLPLAFEWRWVKSGRLAKTLWVLCFPILYVLRGAVMRKQPQFWELVNWAWTVASDILVLRYCGGRGLLYLFLSLLFGYGLHPCAAHFIQEHYTFTDNSQETYSYYGVLNIPMLNIGYHNEHHDFMQVSWRRLPAVRRLAPEFYDAKSMCHHTSWVRVLWDFIMRPDVGPQSRVAREYEDHCNGRKMMSANRSMNQQ